MQFGEVNLFTFIMKMQVPMFIASRKDEKRDGSSACLLYGYGGFNISLTPRCACDLKFDSSNSSNVSSSFVCYSFSITQLFFVQHFGYLAIPNIRGGGEYGEKWHKGGCLLNKQVNININNTTKGPSFHNEPDMF